MHAGAYRRTANTCRKKAKSRNILPDRKFYQTVGAGLRARPQSLILADFGRTRLFSVPSKSRDLLCASAHRGTPGEGSPRQNSPPDCFGDLPALIKKRVFAPCAERPKTLSLESAAFEKAGEILLSGRQFAKTFRFFCPTESFSYPYNRNSAKLLSGQASKEIIARPARICSAAARAAIHCALARAGGTVLQFVQSRYRP